MDMSGIASRRDNLVVNTANDGIGFRPVLTFLNN